MGEGENGGPARRVEEEEVGGWQPARPAAGGGGWVGPVPVLAV
jgi:hypothetical protein